MESECLVVVCVLFTHLAPCTVSRQRLWSCVLTQMYPQNCRVHSVKMAALVMLVEELAHVHQGSPGTTAPVRHVWCLAVCTSVKCTSHGASNWKGDSILPSKSPNSSFSRFPYMTSLIMSHCQALTNSVLSLYAIQWQQKGLGFNGIYVMVAYLWSSDHVLMSSRRSCSMCMCTHQKVLKDDPNFYPLAAAYVTHSSTDKVSNCSV